MFLYKHRVFRFKLMENENAVKFQLIYQTSSKMTRPNPKFPNILNMQQA